MLWTVQHHGIFQGHDRFHHIGPDPGLRGGCEASPHFEPTAQFCELFDGPAFDPRTPTLPVEAFPPLLQRVMAQPWTSLHRPAPPR